MFFSFFNRSNTAVVLPKPRDAQLREAEDRLLSFLPQKDLERLDLERALIRSVVEEDGSRTITVHERNGDDISESPLRILNVPNGQGFSFRGSSLHYCRFEGDFSYNDFRFCSLIKADFAQASLQGATFQQPFKSTIGLSGITWPKDECGQIYTQATIYGPNFIDLDLRIFSEIISPTTPYGLFNMDLSNLDLQKVSFSGAIVEKCRLKETILPKSLSRATFCHSELINVTLPEDLGWSDFSSASFSNTDMRAVRFHTGNFDGTTFNNCQLPEEIAGYDKIEVQNHTVKLSRQNKPDSNTQGVPPQTDNRKLFDFEQIDFKKIPSSLKALFNGVNDGEVLEMILPRETKPPHIHVYYLTRIKNSGEILILQIDNEIEGLGFFFANLFRVDERVNLHRKVSRVNCLLNFDSPDVVEGDLTQIIFSSNVFGRTSIKFGNNKRIITTAGTSGLVGESAEDSGESRFLENIEEARRILTKTPS
jgi:uncharacterized protein YjbI with pentapeptide repeats